MYELIFGHFHGHRKSNMAAMASIFNFCRNILPGLLLFTKSDIDMGFSVLAAELTLFCAHFKIGNLRHLKWSLLLHMYIYI